MYVYVSVYLYVCVPPLILIISTKFAVALIFLLLCGVTQLRIFLIYLHTNSAGHNDDKDSCTKANTQMHTYVYTNDHQHCFLIEKSPLFAEHCAYPCVAPIKFIKSLTCAAKPSMAFYGFRFCALFTSKNVLTNFLELFQFLQFN